MDIVYKINEQLNVEQFTQLLKSCELGERRLFWLNGTGHFNKRQLTVKY
jgi:hypothetical protein